MIPIVALHQNLLKLVQVKVNNFLVHSKLVQKNNQSPSPQQDEQMGPGGGEFDQNNSVQNIGQKDPSKQATYENTKSSSIMNLIAVCILIITIILVFWFKRRGYKTNIV